MRIIAGWVLPPRITSVGAAIFAYSVNGGAKDSPFQETERHPLKSFP